MVTRFLSTLFSLIAVSVFASNANAACPPVTQTIIISTADQLQNLSVCDTGGRVFELGNDIDLSGIKFPTLNGLQGTLDGKNYAISNMTPDNGGLFSVINSTGTVKNLKLNVNISLTPEATDSYGALAAISAGTVSNVVVNGTFVTKAPAAHIGGLIGDQIGGQIKGCQAFLNMILAPNTSYSGGLVGWQQAGDISYSISGGKITLTGGSTTGIGGLVGKQEPGSATTASTINSSISKPIIDISQASTAFGIGVLIGELSGTVKNSFSAGEIRKSDTSIVMSISGGIAGYIMNGGTLINSYSTSKIDGTSGDNGGLVGLTPDSSNFWRLGVVANSNAFSCMNSYWDTEATGLENSAACSDGGRTTSQMQIQTPDGETYIGWDKQKPQVWQFAEGNYPTIIGIQ